MSFNLWKFFLEDDVDGFRQYLARATYTHSSSKALSASPAPLSLKSTSPGTLATSPKTPSKLRRVAGNAQPPSGSRGAALVITRADINARDSQGRTLLHHAASSYNENAAVFVKALLEVPFVDLYIQDSENGWTALHRALYAGNIDIAQALLTRDILNATDITSSTRTQVGGLIKIKDHESNSPFEVFGLTIAPRALRDPSQSDGMIMSDEEDNNSVDVRDDAVEDDRASKQVRPHTDLRGDEAFAFGSNKNLSLGLGDEDDRQFPERIHLERPEHLLWRLYKDLKSSRYQISGSEDMSSSIVSLHQSEDLPAIVKHKPIKIQDIIMAKLHTAVLTDDPVSNLHICGFGPGGRLGTGDETTRFRYVCIQGGGLASRRVSSIALGQDHCVAICSSGEVFTWGSNKYGQLGYVLPEVSSTETPMQLMPRQLYGLIKKESIIGAAASSIHSVIYTTNGLYTFGKNEGQLGLMDADARSLKIQDIPRRVGVSLVQSQIKAVSAIDRATTVLLENHDVIVFTHYGFTKVAFPLEDSNIFLSQALPTRYSKEANAICKITSGGNTIGALSTFGQVFTVDVPKPSESVPSSVSTTNPNKAKNALPVPNKVWTLKKSHMSAVDVAIGQDGSIVLCTEAGAVWRKEKRANIQSVHVKGSDNNRSKDYKFVRVPHLTRVIAVRSNAFGAFTAVRKDCDVTREQITVDEPLLLDSMFPLLSFHNYGSSASAKEDENANELQLRFWIPRKQGPTLAALKTALLKNQAAEDDFIHLSKRFEPLSETQYDAWITSNVSGVRIPVHSTILKSRSRVLRSCLSVFHETYYFSIPDVLSIEYCQTGGIEITLLGADFLTMVNFVMYMYTETLIDVWHHTSRALHLAPRYRQVRIELMKIASNLELRRLERAVRVMVDPVLSIMDDLEIAYMDLDFYTNADVVIDLAGGAERPAHSLLLSARCPFFEGLFHGRAAGKWLIQRKHAADSMPIPTRVDLKHVEVHIFDLVLRHIYADTSDELFDFIVSKDLDEFIDTVLDVMSVANELMLERLVQICQRVIGRYITPRNVCGLLNAIAESSVIEFKTAALEYICLNLEGMLEQRLLIDLDQYLLEELDEIVKANQLAYMPFVRSDRSLNELCDRHPGLVEDIEKSRQIRIDSMKLQTRFIEEDTKLTPKARIGSYDALGSSPIGMRKLDLRGSMKASPKISPALPPRELGEDMPFDMDEDAIAGPSNAQINMRSSELENSKGNIHASQERASASANRNFYGTSNEDAGNKDPGERASPSVAMNRPKLPDSRISDLELPRVAWKQTSSQGDKADLKQIMEQASTSRVSNLTQAIKAEEISALPVHKMSQRERKRQQQREMLRQQELQQQQVKLSTEASNNTPADVATPQAPWMNATPVSNTNLSTILSEIPSSPKTSQQLQRPSISTRQAVSSPDVRADAQPKQARSISSAVKLPSNTVTAPQVQSIRHAPLPSRSTSYLNAHTSMADILAQQLGEKTAIKEAAAKRSLQEIQQEQEFQEWWDQESKRVQDEAAQASAASNARSERSGRGKTGRRRGSGRGGTSSIPKDNDQKAPNQQPQDVPTETDEVTRGGGESRGRARGRGRGRGRPRHGPDAGTTK